MGKFLDRFKRTAENVDERVNRKYAPNNRSRKINSHLKTKVPESIGENMYDGVEEDMEEDFDEERDYEDDGMVSIQPAQKPESFHHYILENQYQELEKSIRGYKDVFNKETREWDTKRKDLHCFTDEEAEDILRLAQSLLATDIKLSFINKESFPVKAMMLFKQIKILFRQIAEYRYGRYSHNKDGTEKKGGYGIEQAMKLQNLKIFVELSERIVANFSRAIQGMENKQTHQSVKGQESLHQSGQDGFENKRYT